MEKHVKKAIDTFAGKFKTEPDVIAAAPGRVNIIGEHTDYTGGLVLPVAIDKEVIFAVKKSQDGKVSGYSRDFDQEVSFKVGDYNPEHPCSWLRYILGVLSELKISGNKIGGFDFTVMGNVPIGSGLSSSAALELSVCTAMQGLFDFDLDGKEAALLCQRAENNFVGMNCGIMDQYISSIGKRDHAVKIDCRDLSTETIKVNTLDHTWLVIDSGKRRSLVDSEYNKRRQECEEGLKIAQTVFPGKNISNLRDLTLDDLQGIKPAGDTIYKRVKHVVTENQRVEITAKALQSGDIEAVGENLWMSHASLRDDYEVSCRELDMLVDILSGIKGVAGARLTGAGFGGCIIALVKNEALQEVEKDIREKYRPDSLPENIKAEIWPIKISDGARIIKQKSETF